MDTLIVLYKNRKMSMLRFETRKHITIVIIIDRSDISFNLIKKIQASN